ncbi:LAFE_0E10000g1_1 [Lachancea fermentati]|uniref:LAFE_0E10000g1_1 n=1 Tax=Lachancea fermentati TaxID=4955 RepID=A0A1G4MDF0_LACFM|nr:LAFE_0E10000g1_1 [Lachancea fermentati]
MNKIDSFSLKRQPSIRSRSCFGSMLKPTGDVLGKYLPRTKQKEIISDLVETDELEEVFSVLCAITFQEEVLDEVSDEVKDKISSKLAGLMVQEHPDGFDTQSLEIFAKVLSQMDAAYSKMLSWIYEKLLSFAQDNLSKFHGQGLVAKRLEGASGSQSFDTESKPNIVVLLDFLEKVFTFREGHDLPHTDLDLLLVYMNGFNNETVASISAKLVKWRIPEISKNCALDEQFDNSVWQYVRTLFDITTESWKIRNGLLFLMRSLMTRTVTKSLVDFMKESQFWAFLQFGLAHEVHELRKLSLSILKLSLQNMPHVESFTNPFVVWLEPAKKTTLDFFKKFTTLYEIVALDTALNQYEAAHEDILQLFQSTLLPPSWGLIIISTGLKASMESVRRYTVKLMFDIQDKSVFQDNLTELRDNYLPSCMNAQYFNVNGQECAHGEALSQFVEGILASSVEKVDEQSASKSSVVLHSLLESLYNQKSAFDPARIYVAFGILNALKKKRLHIVNETHFQIIKKLFSFESEEEVFETTIRELCLSFLMFVDMETSPISWIDTIAQEVKTKFGDYSYVSIRIDDFIDVAVTSFDKYEAENILREFNTDDTIFQVLTFAIFGILPTQLEPKFLIEVGRSGASLAAIDSFHYTSLLSSLLLGDKDDSTYENCFELVDLPLFNSQTWSLVDLNTLFNSLKKEFGPNKFKFFVEIYRRTVQHSMNLVDIKLTTVIEFYSLIADDIRAHNNATFKYKDSIYGDYFTFIKAYLQSYALVRDENTEADEVFILLKLMQRNVSEDNGNFLGNLAVIQLCEYLLDTYVVPTLQSSEECFGDDRAIVEQISLLLSAIWDDVSSERLVLHQKELHLAFIKTMFHPMVLFFALDERETTLAARLLKYGLDIVEQSYSRRTLLPTLSKRFDFFVQTCGDHFCGCGEDYDWMITLLVNIFTQTQMDTNIFKLKPVIATLFDKKLGVLLDSPEGLYNKIYGGPEVASRVFVIGTIMNSTAEFKERFMEYLIEKDKNFLRARKGTDGAEELQRLLKWQLLLLSIKSVYPDLLHEYVEDKIAPSLLHETSPLVRLYMEWFIAYDLVHYDGSSVPSNVEDAMFKLLQNHTKPILAITAERILYIATKAQCVLKHKLTFLKRFLPQLISNCTSNKPLIRHFSNSLILSFWPSLQEYITDSTVREVIENLFENAKSTQLYGQYRSGDANVWDLENDLNLTSMFGGVIMKISDHSVPYIDEKTFSKYLSSRDLFPLGRDETDSWLAKRSSNKDIKVASGMKNSPLQTKSGAWETVMDVENRTPNSTVRRSELIVVASMVDKAPNLGGICRLCDVLGVGLMTVHDIRVKQHPQFKNVAVTADRWMPIEAVAIEDIVRYMRSKKREGYTLIGLEQTDKSVKLDNHYQFPPKSLILLGTEAEGIPGYMLSELDLCLEIKQSGVIRSMNIQTATAVIVHSYSAQHM